MVAIQLTGKVTEAGKLEVELPEGIPPGEVRVTIEVAEEELPPEEAAELDALKALSDDALWTMARDQLPDDVQARAHELMDRNSLGTISDEEYAELEQLVDRADRLMVRKAEAGSLLRQRGYPFTQQDYKR